MKRRPLGCTLTGTSLVVLVALASMPACGSGAPQEPAAAPAAQEPTATPAPATTPAAPVAAPTAESESAPPKASAETQPSAPAPPPSRCPEGMALVPGGRFKRAGTPAPKDLVDLCFDVTETSAARYSECVEAGACTTTGLDCAEQTTYAKPDKADHPLVCAEFSQALAYCAFRDKRLPTTEEWEWAARGGDEARRYPWGNDKPDGQLCWTGKHKQTETCAIGSYPAGDSRHGLKDLAGNVLEFTTTDADKHSTVRIARGGSWRDGAPELFLASRLGGFGLDYRCGFLGIRCVTEAAPP